MQNDKIKRKCKQQVTRTRLKQNFDNLLLNQCKNNMLLFKLIILVVHFSAGTFVAPFLSFFCSGTNYKLFWWYLRQISLNLVLFYHPNLKKIHQLLMVKFWTNLVCNISTQKVPYWMPDKHFLQIRCRFIAHRSWVCNFTWFIQQVKIPFLSNQSS